MEHFIAATKLIRTTPNYPAEGIAFADLSAVMTSASLRHLLRILCANIGVDRDWVLVGVPTRGCQLALLAAIASGLDRSAACPEGPAVVQLQKGGAGTPMPGSVELCRSGTVYSGGRQTTFLIDEVSAASIRGARRVVVCDDVVESGATATAIVGAIRALNADAHVSVACLLHLRNDLSDNLPFLVHAVMEKRTPDAPLTPSWWLSRRPTLLGTLRGADTVPAHLIAADKDEWLFADRTAVYGPPSLAEHVIAYVANAPHAFVGLAHFDYFAGGGFNFRVQQYTKPCHAVFLYDASAHIDAQNTMVRALAAMPHVSLRIVVLYMPQATMERNDVPSADSVLWGQRAAPPMSVVPAAKYFLDALCAGLPDGTILELIDVHCTAEASFVPSNVRVVLSSALRRMVPKGAHIVAFPDAGARNRFGSQFRGFTHVVCSKTRTGAERSVHITQVVGPLPIAGNEVWLVDDLTRTGNTLIETARALKAAGASRVHVVFVHADLEPGRARALIDCDAIDTITCSDSCPQKAYALREAAGDPDDCRVIVKSVLGFAASTIDQSISLAPIAAVASTNEDKCAAAFAGFQRTNMRIVGLLPFAADSRVPEQPVGDEQGLAGARNRLASTSSLFACFPRVPTVAFESFMRKRADGSYVDTVCAMLLTRDNDVLGPGYVEGAVPPTEAAERAIARGMVVGALLQQEHNLPDKAAWIDCFAPNHETRVVQLELAMVRCDAGEGKVFRSTASGGR